MHLKLFKNHFFELKNSKLTILNFFENGIFGHNFRFSSSVQPKNSNKIKCTACDLPFDEAIEARQPRILPCLHSFCTQCLMKAYDYLEIVAQNSLKRRPSSRYSWRNRDRQSPSRSSSPSRNVNILGHFLCPICFNVAPMVVGGRESIKNGFPLDPLALVTSESTNGKKYRKIHFVWKSL